LISVLCKFLAVGCTASASMMHWVDHMAWTGMDLRTM